VSWRIITPVILLCLSISCKRETSKLTFAVGGAPSEIEYWAEIAREFTDSTKIDIILLRQPTDTDQRRQGLVIPLRAKKSDPDVFLMDVVWVSQFAASGWLESLDPGVETRALDLSKFFSSIVEQVDTYQDQIISLPVYNDCGILYYRSDLLQKYDIRPPTTWHELVHSATLIQEKERLKNPQFYGFVWQGAQYEGLICSFLEFITSNNGSIFNSSHNLVLPTPRNISALDLMKKMIHEHKISPPNTYTEMKEEEVRLSFENGNALYERNWPYAWGLHTRPESPIKKNVAVTLIPKASAGRHVAALGGWHVGISRFSDNKKQAMEFLKYIVSYAIQKKLAIDLGWNPGRSDLYDDTEIREKIPHIEVLKRAFENSVARPNLPYYPEISEILQKYINAALSAKLSSSVALAKAQAEIEEIVKRYHE